MRSPISVQVINKIFGIIKRGIQISIGVVEGGGLVGVYWHSRVNKLGLKKPVVISKIYFKISFYVMLSFLTELILVASEANFIRGVFRNACI